jgi:hypothetical protein
MNNKSLRYKVLCFDKHALGVRHFSVLRECFVSNGYEFKIIVENLNPDDEVKYGRDRFEIVNRNSHKKKSLLKIIESENPALVFVLQVDGPYFGGVVESCKILKIPVVHLAHGMYSVGHVSGLKNKNSWSTIKKIGLYLAEIFNSNFIEYLSTCIRSNKITRVVLLLIYNYARSLFGSKKVNWNWTAVDHSIVYNSSEKNHYCNMYDIDQNKVYVAGNPDFVRCSVSDSDLLSNMGDSGKNIVYIEANSLYKVFNDDLSDFAVAFSKICKEVSSYGLTLSVKCHPATTQKGGNRVLEGIGINTIGDKEFIESLRHARAVISEPTSIVLVACAIGVRLFTFERFFSHSFTYGEEILKYPYIHHLSCINKVIYCIGSSVKRLPKIEDEQWLESNIYPLPIQNYTDRVFNHVNSIVLSQNSGL